MREMTRSVLLVSAGFVVCLGLLHGHAEPTGQKLGPGFGQRYLLLATSQASTMQEELREAAAAGYRVVGGWSAPEITPHSFTGGQYVVLLERAAAPPNVYDYLLIDTQRASKLEKEIREAGARGYRLLPYASIGRPLMEKAPGSSTRYEYLSLAHEFAADPATGEAMPASLETMDPAAAARGFAIVGRGTCSGTKGGEHLAARGLPAPLRHTFIAERSIPPDSETGTQEVPGAGRARQIVVMARRAQAPDEIAPTLDLQRPLRQAAGKGYRLVLADARCPEAVMVLEDVLRSSEPRGSGVAANPPGPWERDAGGGKSATGAPGAETTPRTYEYVIVGGQDEMSAAAADGFHPHPAGILTWAVPDKQGSQLFGVIMERAPGPANADRYSFVQRQHSSRLQEQLIDAGQAGLDVVATARDAHMIIVRKQTGRTVAPAPAPATEEATPDPHRRWTLYVPPMDGMQPYLIAAIAVWKVPVVLVDEPKDADLEMSGTAKFTLPSKTARTIGAIAGLAGAWHGSGQSATIQYTLDVDMTVGDVRAGTVVLQHHATVKAASESAVANEETLGPYRKAAADECAQYLKTALLKLESK